VAQSRRPRVSNLERLNEALARVLDGQLLDARGNPVHDSTADRVLVSMTATQLRQILHGRRNLGIEGWHARKHRNAKLLAELIDRAHGGQWIDVIRLAAVLVAREHLYGPEA
jgi:hypothetical protein